MVLGLGRRLMIMPYRMRLRLFWIVCINAMRLARLTLLNAVWACPLGSLVIPKWGIWISGQGVWLRRILRVLILQWKKIGWLKTLCCNRHWIRLKMANCIYLVCFRTVACIVMCRIFLQWQIVRCKKGCNKLCFTHFWTVAIRRLKVQKNIYNN